MPLELLSFIVRNGIRAAAGPLAIISAHWRMFVALVALVLAFYAGWHEQGIRAAAEAAKLQAQGIALRDAAYADLQTKLAESDQHHTQALQDMTNENDRLRSAVAAGTVRLRCPSSGVPGNQAAATGAGVGNGAGPELDPGAGQAVLNLRAGIIRQAEQLSACQDILADERQSLPAMSSADSL